jgi:hypothetical protein
METICELCEINPAILIAEYSPNIQFDDNIGEWRNDNVDNTFLCKPCSVIHRETYNVLDSVN